MKLTAENEYLRLFLYRRDATDEEIAEATGVGRFGVRKWRKSRGLLRAEAKPAEPAIPRDYAGIPMEKALSPGQCLVMEKFLRGLVWAANRAKAEGLGKLDVAAFIKAWRDVYAEEITLILEEGVNHGSDAELPALWA